MSFVTPAGSVSIQEAASRASGPPRIPPAARSVCLFHAFPDFLDLQAVGKLTRLRQLIPLNLDGELLGLAQVSFHSFISELRGFDVGITLAGVGAAHGVADLLCFRIEMRPNEMSRRDELKRFQIVTYGSEILASPYLVETISHVPTSCGFFRATVCPRRQPQTQRTDNEEPNNGSFHDVTNSFCRRVPWVDGVNVDHMRLRVKLRDSCWSISWGEHEGTGDRDGQQAGLFHLHHGFVFQTFPPLTVFHRFGARRRRRVSGASTG